MNRRKRYDLSKYSISDIEKGIREWIPNKEYRKILKLAYIDGESNEMIAEECDCSTGMVKYVIKLAYPRLIDCLEAKNNN